jgi:hypothetical protein
MLFDGNGDQLAAVRYLPWAKRSINYTGQALIISAGNTNSAQSFYNTPCLAISTFY